MCFAFAFAFLCFVIPETLADDIQPLLIHSLPNMSVAMTLPRCSRRRALTVDRSGREETQVDDRTLAGKMLPGAHALWISAMVRELRRYVRRLGEININKTTKQASRFDSTTRKSTVQNQGCSILNTMLSLFHVQRLVCAS